MSLELQSLVILGGLSLLLAFGIEIAPAMGIVAGLGTDLLRESAHGLFCPGRL